MFSVGAQFGNFAACLTIRNLAHALSSQWLYFLLINRNTPCPWSSSQTEDLMVLSNSQDENIPLLTEVCHGQCQESYLFAIILGLIYEKFILTHVLFSLLARPPKRFCGYPNVSHKLVCSSCCLFTFPSYYVNFANGNTEIIISTVYWNRYKSITSSSRFMITLSSKST